MGARWVLPVIGLLLLGRMAAGQATVTVEYTNQNIQPSHWVLVVHPDGSGVFDSDAADAEGAGGGTVHLGAVHRELQLSQGFTERVFAVARERKLFNFKCDSGLKVAFQGIKRLSYEGPEGTGSCAYNYSKDETIENLGDQVIAVATTIEAGERLKRLQQHDRLGLDREMEELVVTAHQVQAIELGVIRDVLERIVADDQLLERVRKKARLLLGDAR